MKKIYISPEMDVIEYQNQQMLLAGSVVFNVEDTTIPAENVDAPIFEDGALDLFAE
jgi:hypothetical protein